MKTKVTKAWVRPTQHPTTGITSYDVLVHVKASTSTYIESIHPEDQSAAKARAKKIMGQKVNLLDLVPTH